MWAIDIPVRDHVSISYSGHAWWAVALAVAPAVAITFGLIWMRRRSSASAG
jgi:hypothetical protein